MPTSQIDHIEDDLDSLSDEARAQLKARVAAMQTANNAGLAGLVQQPLDLCRRNTTVR